MKALLDLNQSLPRALCLVALFLAPGCEQKKTARAPVVIPVQTARTVREDVAITQTAIGAVQPLRTVAVKSRVDGVIDRIHFKEGQEVKAGDILATLDRQPFENELSLAQAELVSARAEALQADADGERYQRLDQKQAISQQELVQIRTKAGISRAAVQAREAAVANAELQLGYTTIRAPISGRTGQLQLHEGSLLRANDATQSLVVINQTAPIAVTFSVPETVLGAFRAAQAAGPVEVIASIQGAAAAKGQLEFVDHAVDAATGTILLKAVFPNDDRALWPGQFVDVTAFIGIDRGAVIAPTIAVQDGQSGKQVFVLKPDHTVELRPVSLGRAAGGRTILLKGVEPGETVVTDGQLRLTPGAKVEERSIESAVARAAKALVAAKPSR